MRETVAARDVQVGMFVADLDRPWLGTPFILQGFLVEDDAQRRQIAALCRVVHIDRTRSIGDHYRAAPAATVKHGNGARVATSPQPTGAERGTDFLALLRLVRQGKPVRPGDVPAPASAAPPPPGSAVHSDPTTAAHAERTLVEEELLTVANVWHESKIQVENLIADVKSGVRPDLEAVRESVGAMMQSVVRNPDALLWLTRLKRRDADSYSHALDVSVHLMVFGRHLGIDEPAMRLLGMAGLMQDLGKLRLPRRLFKNMSTASASDVELFRKHVEYSIEILRTSPSTSPELIQIVAQHHERIDGSGYPAGLRREDIGLHAEMAGLVDSYCTMTNPRRRGRPLSGQQALERINRMRGKTFTTSIVDQFVQCIGLYPVGTLVELNSGEVGVVIGQNRVRRLKPKVMVLLGADKRPNPFPPTIDLLYDPRTPTGVPYSIKCALPAGAHGIDPQDFYLA